MTLIKDEKGRLRHEKEKPVEQQITCAKCGVPTMYSKSPLNAILESKRITKTIKNRKTGAISYKKNIKEEKKTGEYICKNCT